MFLDESGCKHILAFPFHLGISNDPAEGKNIKGVYVSKIALPIPSWDNSIIKEFKQSYSLLVQVGKAGPRFVVMFPHIYIEHSQGHYLTEFTDSMRPNLKWGVPLLFWGPTLCRKSISSFSVKSYCTRLVSIFYLAVSLFVSCIVFHSSMKIFISRNNMHIQWTVQNGGSNLSRTSVMILYKGNSTWWPPSKNPRRLSLLIR